MRRQRGVLGQFGLDDGREIGLAGVRALVSRQLRERPAPVIILSDADARTSPLVDLIDECKLAGAKQVSIAARRE